jgi:hypothetical protein
LTSAIAGGDYIHSRAAGWPPEASLKVMEKRKSTDPAEKLNPAVQPVARQRTDWAISAEKWLKISRKSKYEVSVKKELRMLAR